MKIFSAEYLNNLSTCAQDNRRKRQHRNIHQSYEDPCQRLFNAIEPGSYIRPHRHATDPKAELLIAVRGLMALVLFNELGIVMDIVHFGAGKSNEGHSVGAEVPCNSWHTVVALEPGCILLEVKPGPFDPKQAKDLAPWAPDEASSEASDYLNELIAEVTG